MFILVFISYLEYDKVIRNKIEERIQSEHRDQSGFMAGQSIINQIYIVQQLLEINKAKK